MKKMISMLLFCVMIMSMAACTNTYRFESESALMEHLNGMWVLDDNREDKTYYVFQDGKIYSFSDVQFSYKIEDFLDSFVSDSEVDALRKLDYTATIGEMDAENVLGGMEENVSIQPDKSIIIIDEGETYEKSIIVTQERVCVKENDEEYGIDLIKLSDTLDFSGEHFKEIFEEIREDFAVPAAKIVTAENYLSFTKKVFVDTNDWILVDQGKQSALYTSDGNTKGSFGSYIISDNGLDYFRGRAADGSAAFTIMYDLDGTLDWNLFVYDRTGISLNQLLDYATPVLSVFPGALSAEQIISLFNQECKVYGKEYQYKTTENGITYTIKQATNGSATAIYITLPETVSLKDLANAVQTAPEESQLPTTQLPTTELPTTESPTTQPPTTESPTTQPPTTESPTTQPPTTQPPTTQPPTTQPPTTQPPTTRPPTTQPPVTQVPTVCSHQYTEATCTEPKICTKCGETVGSAAGHKWTNITQTVHHEEQGHYEDVQEAKKVQKYRCWLCSYAQPTYTTKDEYYAHFDSAHGDESNSSFFRERYEKVEDWVYETVTEWVIDQEAYTETVVTGRKCDICGEKE